VDDLVEYSPDIFLPNLFLLPPSIGYKFFSYPSFSSHLLPRIRNLVDRPLKYMFVSSMAIIADLCPSFPPLFNHFMLGFSSTDSFVTIVEPVLAWSRPPLLFARSGNKFAVFPYPHSVHMSTLSGTLFCWGRLY